MLNEAAPPAELLFPTAIWHYARGLAFLRTEQPDSAKTELGSLEALTTEDNISRMDFRGVNATRSVLRIAASILAGEIAASAGDYDKGIDHLRAAVELEDNLGYYEPPVWFSPSRQILGALLLEAGRPVDAEEVYRRDLEEYPNNGWSLFGLYSALMSQGKNSEAEDIKSQFDEAWSRADVSLTSSRM
jgi:tetratricopeptide (TPR) repeat protein